MVALGVALVGPDLGGVAAAAPRPPKGFIECSTVQSEGETVSSPIELGDCSRPLATGGSGTTTALGAGPYPITWATGRKTDDTKTSGGFHTPSRCPAGELEYDLHATITSVSGPWTKQFLGQPLSEDVCLDASFGITELVPGTLFTIGKPSVGAETLQK